MDYFEEYLNENDELRSIVDRAMQYPSHIQGVMLEVHPLFLAFWTLKYKFQDYNLIYERLKCIFYDYCGRCKYLDLIIKPDAIYNELGIDKIEFFEGGINKNHLSYYWNDLLKHIDVPPSSYPFQLPSNPIIVKICYYPHSESETTERNPQPRFESNNFFIVHETRPVAELYSTKDVFTPLLGGISIGVDNRSVGTLGGILTDVSTKKVYALSCGHVVQDSLLVSQPSLKDSNKSREIGKVSIKINPTPCLEGSPCNEFSSIINSLDTALIELLSTDIDTEILEIGKIDDVYSKKLICQDRDVQYTARTSGHQTARTGGYGVFYRLQTSDKKYACFRGLLEIKKDSRFWKWNHKFIDRGDSGGLVCIKAGKGTEVCSMIVGGDGEKGYSIIMENIKDWWQTNGLDLSFSVP